MNSTLINIIEIIKKEKEESNKNRTCKYCGVKINIRHICTKCTMTINNYKLKERGYFKQYYDKTKKPIEEQKKRGPKPKPKKEDEVLESAGIAKQSAITA